MSSCQRTNSGATPSRAPGAQKKFGFCSVMPISEIAAGLALGDGRRARLGRRRGGRAGVLAVFFRRRRPRSPSGSRPPMRPRRAASDRRDLFLLRHAEGGAATAGCDHVGVLDLEAGALQALDVVHDRATDVGQARPVDQQPQAVILEDLVAVALVSNASAYWKPEQPPPRTPTRRPDVVTSAFWDARNSLTFCAPVSVKVIMVSGTPYSPIGPMLHEV